MMKNIFSQKYLVIILTILLFGAMQKIYVTSGGNFIFNMDNARDFVDVREMVELRKPRLIGPTSAIEGFYNGPGWYLLLAIPYILTQGDPYGAILLMVFLWAIGGFFLMRLVSKHGLVITLAAGFLWVGSDYINLATVYSFNPNPVTFLAPLFIFLTLKYLEERKIIFLAGAAALGGAFFNFEMNFGVFVLPIIFTSVILSGNLKLIKTRGFWLGLIPFFIALLPQFLFDLRHQFVMTLSVVKFLSEKVPDKGFDLITRTKEIYEDFYYVTLPVFLNNKLLLKLVTISVLSAILIKMMKRIRQTDNLFVISATVFLLPFVAYIFLPVEVNGWHLGAEMVGLIIVFFLSLVQLQRYNIAGKIMVLLLMIFSVYISVNNIYAFVTSKHLINNDPSLYKNEISAIEYTYQKSNDKNFKAYVYLPSVIDYPYQYLFWWYGLRKYGYTPEDYAYLPNKPSYIDNKDFFVKPRKNVESSGLVFLIKEPDRINIRHLWQNSFAKLEKVDDIKLRGIEIETLKDGEIINF